MDVEVELAMQALLRFRPIANKPLDYAKRNVFLCTEPRGLVAMRCDGAHIWATTVPWYTDAPAKPVSYATTTQAWAKACKAYDGRAPWATHEHVLSVNGVELPRTTSKKFMPTADLVHRIRCGKWETLSPHVPATDILDEIRNAVPDPSGNVSVGSGKHQYVYKWQAIMRWLAACFSETTFSVAFSPKGAMYLKSDTEAFELVLMRVDTAKEA